jgi:hypothetical protein
VADALAVHEAHARGNVSEDACNRIPPARKGVCSEYTAPDRIAQAPPVAELLHDTRQLLTTSLDISALHLERPVTGPIRLYFHCARHHCNPYLELLTSGRQNAE